MSGPLTPERRLWLVIGLLETFGLELTTADYANPSVSWPLGKVTRLMLTGIPDTPLLMLFYQDQLFASVRVRDPVDITAQLHLIVHQPGDFPDLAPFDEPWRLLKRLLRAGRKLVKERAAG